MISKKHSEGTAKPVIWPRRFAAVMTFASSGSRQTKQQDSR